jgi:hypothetical protein
MTRLQSKSDRSTLFEIAAKLPAEESFGIFPGSGCAAKLVYLTL